MNEKRPANKDLSLAAVLLTSMLCIIFGSNAVAIKISYLSFGPFTTAGIRFGIASIVIIFWAIITKKPLKIQKDQVLDLSILTIIFFVQLSIFHFGMSKTNATRSTLIINVQPFILLFLAHFFIEGEKITLKKLIGISIGFIGISLLFFEKNDITAELQYGDFLILVTSILWAVAALYTKRIIHNYHPFQLVFFPMLFSFPLFLLEGFLWDPFMVQNIDFKGMTSILYQGLVTGSIGYVLWNELLLRHGAVTLHSYIFITPIAGVVFAGIILDEPVTLTVLFSLVFIVAGIIVISYRKTVKRTASEPADNSGFNL